MVTNFVQSLVGCEMFFSKTEENRGNGILIKPQEKGVTGRGKGKVNDLSISERY